MDREVGDIVKLKSSKDIDNPIVSYWEKFHISFDEGIECVIEEINVYYVDFFKESYYKSYKEPYRIRTVDGSNPYDTYDGTLWVSESDLL